MNRFYELFFARKSAAWTAIFTSILAVFTWLLFDVARQANQTSIATQRAFISFVGIVGIEKVNGESPNSLAGYLFHIPMTNSGTTATKSASSEISIATQDAPPREDTNFELLPHSARHNFIFGPKQVYDGTPLFVPLNDLIPGDQGKKHLILWGWVVYRDIFENTPVRLSEICLNIVNPKWTKANPADQTGELKVDSIPCDTHYCYENSCADYPRRIEGFQ